VITVDVNNHNHQTELALQYADHYWQHTYLGGVCWVKVQDGGMASQIVEFATSKLGLKPPETEDLHSQIHYCWSHWQEGGVLVVFDNVINYEQVKAYLPPNEPRFHVLITTPLESLDESLDDSFELLYSKVRILEEELEDKLNSASENSNELLPNNFFYILLTYLFILLVIIIGSLTTSYYLFTSTAWKNAFGEQGWIIELTRGLFFLTGTLVLIGVVFPKEACELLSWNRTSPTTNKEIIYFARISILFLLPLALIIIINHHLYTGPHELLNNPKNSSIKIDFIKDCLQPYLYYLPYSIVNINFICLPLITVGIYAAVKDLMLLRKFRKALASILNSIIKNREEYNPLDKESCEKMEEIFEEFAVKFIDKFGRYTYLVLGSGFTTAFEYWFGKYTLSNTAQTWTAIGYFLLFSIFALICAGFFFYEDAFSESYNILNKVGCFNRKSFENNYNVIKLVERVFHRYLFLCVGLIILTLTIIHMLFIS
jgi:hypothetical protein